MFQHYLRYHNTKEKHLSIEHVCSRKLMQELYPEFYNCATNKITANLHDTSSAEVRSHPYVVGSNKKQRTCITFLAGLKCCTSHWKFWYLLLPLEIFTSFANVLVSEKDTSHVEPCGHGQDIVLFNPISPKGQGGGKWVSLLLPGKEKEGGGIPFPGNQVTNVMVG